MEAKATRLDWTIDRDGTWIKLLIPDAQAARAYATANADKPQRVRLTQWRERRSLNANRYAWELLGKLSEKLAIPPEEIYWQMVPDVGGNYTTATFRLEDVKAIRDMWCQDHIGRRVEVMGASGPGLVDVMIYKGSSDYDTAQMARLIDLIIQECREQGIEYLPPERLSAMLEEWHEKQKDKGSGD